MERDRRGTWPSALLSLAGAVLMILTIRWAFFEPYVIPSGSMIPTLLIHDHIMVNKLSYGVHVPFTEKWLLRFSPPRRGDVIVFRSIDDDSVFLIKRVVGLPGDEVRVTTSGQLMINSQLVERRQLATAEVAKFLASWPDSSRDELLQRYDLFEENFDGKMHNTLRAKDSAGRDQGPYQVPPDELFMMGDNRDNSADSRVWGTLPISHVLGRASWIWLSCESTLPDAAQVCDPNQIRWNRLATGLQ